LHIKAAVAEEEARKISLRTKAALQAAKARGTKLGNPRWADTIERARAARSPNPTPPQVLRQIKAYRNDGWTLRAIAAQLNAMGIETPRGCRWGPEAIRRALALTTQELTAQ
jgi:DNA invertase Pin-like site-specific DNA recombinase